MLIPKFKPKYHVEHVPQEGVFLLSENESHVLEGASLERIAPLINGTNTWDQIRATVQTELGPEATQTAIDVLLQNGHVVNSDAYMPPQFEAFWNELGKDAAQARALIAQTHLQIQTVGDADAGPVLRALQAFGFRTNLGSAPTLLVVVADDYQSPALGPINDHALRYGVPWLLVKPSGLKPHIGPLFVPGRTACWQCLETRLRHNREVEGYIQRRTNRADPLPLTRARIGIAEEQVAAMTALQVVRWLALGQNPELESRLMTFEVLSLGSAFHTVLKRPQCAACGDPSVADVAGKPLEIASHATVRASENGSRLETPEATFQRYQHHLSDITGIVKGLFPSPWNGVSPLAVYTAGHNFALKNNTLYFLKDGLRTNSSGKGRTDAQARTSALCEALERYSGLFRGEEQCRIASYTELGEEAVDPRTVLLFSDTQYDEREKWLARGSRFQVVPERFDPDDPISWSPLWSWTEKRVKYLPTSTLYYGFDDANGRFYAWGDSNGNAAGSSIEDAILQGFLELVERDAVAIWWYNRLRKPAVDLDALADPYFERLKQFFAGAGREFWVLDLTTDTGIPAYAALNRRTNHPVEDIIIGFGAHLDARVAINRAVTEMNQFIPAVMNVGEDGTAHYAFDDPDAIEWWTTATLENQPFLQPDGVAEVPPPATGPSRDIKDQVEECFAVAERLGLEVLVLDQTRPDVGLPVVKVVVPGLRHFWARYAPGRLYDVPVKMGWLDEPLTEDELNPTPLFV